MRLKKYALSLFAMGLLFSCSNNNTTDKTTNENKTTEKTDDTSSKDAVINYLNFIKSDRNFRVDFMEETGLVLKYGDAAVEDKKDTALDVSKQFNGSGTFTEKINLVVVQEKPKSGDESVGSTSVSVSAGIRLNEMDEPEEVNNYINSTFNLYGKNANKLYVAVSKGSEVKWTKGLNTDLDKRIQKIIDAKF